MFYRRVSMVLLMWLWMVEDTTGPSDCTNVCTRHSKDWPGMVSRHMAGTGVASILV